MVCTCQISKNLKKKRKENPNKLYGQPDIQNISIKGYVQTICIYSHKCAWQNVWKEIYHLCMVRFQVPSFFLLVFSNFSIMVSVSHSVMSDSLRPCGFHLEDPTGSFVHGILQTRTMEWVSMPFSRRSSWPQDQTWVSCTAGRFYNGYIHLKNL